MPFGMMVRIENTLEERMFPKEKNSISSMKYAVKLIRRKYLKNVYNPILINSYDGERYERSLPLDFKGRHQKVIPVPSERATIIFYEKNHKQDASLG